MPLLMLGLVAAFLSRNVQLFRSSAQINRLLNQRLQQREAELTRTHEQLRSAERAQVLAVERHRLMQDMHDGVGGQLAALLSLAQARRPDPEHLLQAVTEGLTDLRLIIDSLNQIDDDLALALGSLRGRLQPLLDAAGVTLSWRLDSRLSLPGFGPESVLHVYRIVQEAVSNALRHSQARTLTIALERIDDQVELRIEDDGRGFHAFDATSANTIKPGLGLSAMAERAERLGATLHHEQRDGGGTCVRLRWRHGRRDDDRTHNKAQ
jgi:signal transduction histidine kinase